jgi:hypothetical protein
MRLTPWGKQMMGDEKARPPVIYPNEAACPTCRDFIFSSRLPDCPVDKAFRIREQMYTQMLAISIPEAHFSAENWSTFWRRFF